MRILAACKNCHAQYDVSGHTANDSFHCRCGGLIVVPEGRPHEARLVRCASCGAVRGSGGLNCEFCGARFSTVDKGWGSMCPGCFCRLPTDGQFCVECGLKINPQKLDAVRSDLQCPRCACALQSRSLDHVAIFECASCAGLWVPSATFESICAEKETRGKAVALAGTGRRARRVFELTPDEKVKYIPCPVCKNLMNRRNFANISGVIIDACRNDGVWFDNQELSRIVHFIEAGGMDKSRARQQQEAQHALAMRPPLASALPKDIFKQTHAGAFDTVIAGGDVVPLLVRAVAEVASAFLTH